MTSSYISKYDSVMDLVSIDKGHSCETDKCSIYILEYSRLRIIGIFYSDKSTLSIDQIILDCPFKPKKVKEFSLNSCVVGKYIESNIFRELEHARVFTQDELLYEDLIHLDESIESLTDIIKQRTALKPESKRLLSVAGIGPLVCSALLIQLGDGKQYKNGRDFAASLGLTPRQNSTGGKIHYLV